MIFNGNTPSSVQHIAKIKRAPKALRVERQHARGRAMVRFADIRKPDKFDTVEQFIIATDDKNTSREELQHTAPGRAFTDALDVTLSSLAPVCNICHEPIPGNAPRFIQLTLTVPSVGAPATGIETHMRCAACQQAMAAQAPAPQPEETVLVDWKRTARPQAVQAFEMAESGLNQTEIAAHLHVTQGAVSKLLAAAKKARDAAGVKN